MTVVNVEPQVGLLNLALADLLCLVERAAELYGHPVRLPAVTILNERPDARLLECVLRHYYRRGAPGGDTDGRVDEALHHRVTNEMVGRRASDGGDGSDGNGAAVLVFDLEAEDDGPRDRISLKRLREQPPVVLCHTSQPLLGQDPTELPPVDLQSRKPLLDYFARRYFPPVLRLRDEQHQAIARTIGGESLLVLLPTGYGKSLCYQLPAMLVPRPLLVISPLRSLIRDQVWSLRQLGLCGVEALTGWDSAETREERLRQLASGRLRLLYVSPERLQIRSFVGALAAAHRRTNTWALVVDEAHCVSEWGHDFRPAYLQIQHFRKELESYLGRPVPVLALTATASPLVRQDIINVLQVAHTIATISANRREISISVHQADPRGMPRSRLLADLLQQTVPKALGLEAGLLAPDGPPFERAVVVFSIYADPKGRTTRGVGLPEIRQALVEGNVVPAELCRLHCSKTVRVCPNQDCRSHRIEEDRASQTWRCHVCGDEFPSPVSYDSDWGAYLRGTQDAFKRDEFPMLVATKGYGMGIDKRNIRAVIHYTFSSGLEGYYQELGRAGRDREHAHGALVFVPPTPGCIARHLRVTSTETLSFERLEPWCAQGHDFQFWRCPEGLPSLCDYGMQARFITESYPGVETDARGALNTYYQLVGIPQPQVTLLVRESRLTETELALYRLQQLGLVGPPQLEYPNLVTVRVTVTKRQQTAAGLVGDLRAALYAQILSDVEQRRSLVGEHVDRLAGSVANEPVQPALLESALRLLIEHTYASIKSMRYTMLHNLWRYATAGRDDGIECRRGWLLAAFEERVTTETPCGFCDLCAPDLRFPEELARLKPEDATLEELNRELPSILTSFDISKLDTVLDVCRGRSALGSLHARATSHLERDPGNLAALDLASATALERGDREDAMLYSVEGYNVNEREVRNSPAARRFYSRARQVDPVRAADLVDRRGGMFDTPAGHRMMRDDLVSLGSRADPARTAAAQAVVCVDVLRQSAGAIADPELARLLAGLLGDWT